MSHDPASDKSALRPVSGADDIASLFQPTGLGDGITDTFFHTVPIGKPRDFFRVHPAAEYRRRTEIYSHKPEGAMDEAFYIIAPGMTGTIEEARPCTIVTCVYRDGSPRLWPIAFPREGERDNEAWVSARKAANAALSQWVKLLWVRRAYQTREALAGYAPEPDFSKLPPFEDLVKTAFGEHGIIRDRAHPVYRELFGAPALLTGGGDGDIV